MALEEAVMRSQSGEQQQQPQSRKRSEVRLMNARRSYGQIGTEARRQRFKLALGWGYVLAITVFGMVLMGGNMTLEDLAINCGTTSTKVGTVFVAKGAGTGVGALMSPKLYISVRGNTVLSVGLVILSAILLYFPFLSSVFTLHLAFFVQGLVVNILMTGCQIMTRKVHGDKCNLWTGANVVSLGLSSALFPVVAYLDDSLFDQYAILSGISITAAIILGVVIPAPESFEGLIEETPESLMVDPAAGGMEPPEKSTWTRKCCLLYSKYSVEFNIGAMVLWLIGGTSASSSYLDTYVESTGVIPKSQECLLQVDLFAASVVGILLGLLAQLYCTLSSLYRLSMAAFLLGGAGVAAILLFQDSSTVLWICIACYGFAWGPTVNFCYELNNRINPPSESGMSVITFGLTFGMAAFPYATSLVLDYTGVAQWLMVIVSASMLVPGLLLLNIMRIVESKGVHKKCLIVQEDLSSASHPDIGETTRLLK